jgi:hypothetical protein
MSHHASAPCLLLRQHSTASASGGVTKWARKTVRMACGAPKQRLRGQQQQCGQMSMRHRLSKEARAGRDGVRALQCQACQIQQQRAETSLNARHCGRSCWSGQVQRWCFLPRPRLCCPSTANQCTRLAGGPHAQFGSVGTFGWAPSTGCSSSACRVPCRSARCR